MLLLKNSLFSFIPNLKRIRWSRHWMRFFSRAPPHKKALQSLSSFTATDLGIAKRDMKHIGKPLQILLNKVSLPPIERYCLFQRASFLENLSSTTSKADLSLKGAPEAAPNMWQTIFILLTPPLMLQNK